MKTIRVRFNYHKDGGDAGLAKAHKRIQAKAAPFILAGFRPATATDNPFVCVRRLSAGFVGCELESPEEIAERTAAEAQADAELAPFAARAGLLIRPDGARDQATMKQVVSNKSRRAKLAKAAVSLILDGSVRRDDPVALRLINDMPSFGALENRHALLAKIV